jgi:hypothetical protein
MRREPAERYRINVERGIWAYNKKFDSYYDTRSMEWVEPVCPDSDCEFCGKRPPLAPPSTTARGKS